MGTCSQGISQFYLHTPRSSANGMNHTRLCLSQWADRLTEQGLTSHSTHFRSFRRRWGDCGISQDYSRSQSPQCVRCWVVRVRPMLITVVCMCIIWKALCPYVVDARLGLWVSLEHAFSCVSTTNQAERRSSATKLLARWEHQRTTAWWSRAQGGGPCVIPTAGIHYKLRRL